MISAQKLQQIRQRHEDDEATFPESGVDLKQGTDAFRDRRELLQHLSPVTIKSLYKMFNESGAVSPMHQDNNGTYGFEINRYRMEGVLWLAEKMGILGKYEKN